MPREKRMTRGALGRATFLFGKRWIRMIGCEVALPRFEVVTRRAQTGVGGFCPDGLLQEPGYFAIECAKFFRAYAGKAKGLQKGSIAPQRKHHLRCGPHRTGTQVDGQLHPGAFFEASREVQQSAGDGELLEIGAHLSTVFRSYHGRHGAAKTSSRGPAERAALKKMSHGILPVFVLALRAPARPELLRETTAAQFVLNGCHEQAARTAHHSPVVFAGRSAGQADLVMTPVVVDARPREAVRATLPKKQLQEFH